MSLKARLRQLENEQGRLTVEPGERACPVCGELAADDERIRIILPHNPLDEPASPCGACGRWAGPMILPVSEFPLPSKGT